MRRDDEQLLVASLGDADAFAMFYRRHAPAVLAYLRSRTAGMEVAADLTADVFAAAWASRASFDPALGPARAWLFGIANHRLSNEWRSQRRAAAARRRLGVGRLEFDDEALEAAERQFGGNDRLEVFIGGLPEEQREAVLARVVGEEPYEEIARRAGVSQSVIRKRVSRALARLSTSLQRGET